MFDLAGVDPTDGMSALVSELRAERLATLPGAAQSEQLLGVLRAHEELEAEVVRRVGQWIASGAWAEDGAATPAAWLVSRGGLTAFAASELVRTARLAHDHEPTGVALRSGAVRVRNLHLLARAVLDREDAYRENPDVLLGAAAVMVPDEFATVTKRWRVAADDALARADAQRQIDAAHLHASRTLGGMAAIDGLLDPEGGAVFLAALDAYAPTDPASAPSPWRTPAQRRAEALVAVARAALEHRNLGGRVPVTLDVVVDLETLAPDAHAALAARRCDLDRVGPIPRSTMERLACDCSVGRVVMRGPSEVLDLGRRTRLVSAGQRRALVRRDQTCAFPGCDRPHQWTDAHHLVPWHRGGATDLENLALLCRRHHVLCHEGGWHLTRGPDGTFVATPPTPPRGPGPPGPGPPGSARGPDPPDPARGPHGPDGRDLTLAA